MTPHEKHAAHLARKIVEILKVKADAGCTTPGWAGFENGHGEEFGTDVDKLILSAERYLENEKAKT